MVVTPSPLACPACSARLRVVAAERGIARSVAGRLRRVTSGRCPACGVAVVAFADVPGVLPKEIGLAASLSIDRDPGASGPGWLYDARSVASVVVVTTATLLGVWLRFSGLAFAVALLVPASVFAVGAFVAAYTWRGKAARADLADPDVPQLRAADLDGARLELAPDPRTYRDG